MLTALQHNLARGARRAAWVSAGGILMAVGIGFLTVAAWITLSTLRDAQFAALVIGLVYVGVGLVIVALNTRDSHAKTLEEQRAQEAYRRAACPPEDDLFARIAIAFSEGLQAGKALRK
ncbi:phage holin family protein [Celeribacter sp. PS-C1]|uniref:phage holin family protein n=1 Tax=Celeribacter sp. PS-C1 TaxID=2820813 RepID=UPI001C6763FE|nr:phage holin family protein [Celeribacter sp. PS-C1]MBW6416908.1 phage holin family protein [Celeribacter sp. PS-C1]